MKIEYFGGFRYAEQVSIGDQVLVQGNDILLSAKITSISSIKMQGSHYYLMFFLIFQII